jgi:hypothetical protein
MLWEGSPLIMLHPDHYDIRHKTPGVTIAKDDAKLKHSRFEGTTLTTLAVSKFQIKFCTTASFALLPVGTSTLCTPQSGLMSWFCPFDQATIQFSKLLQTWNPSYRHPTAYRQVSERNPIFTLVSRPMSTLHYFPGGLSTERKKRDDRWRATARSSSMVCVALRPKFETTQFIMGQKQCFQAFISVSLRYEMRPVMCILLCGVLGKIPRFMGEFGPRKAHPDDVSEEGSSFSGKRHWYIYMVQDHTFVHVQAVRTRLLGGEPGLWNFFLNVPSERWIEPDWLGKLSGILLLLARSRGSW